jgi:hypothetical protein
MGLFSWLFPDDSSPVEDAITGAVVGSIIGDKLDERADRLRTQQLLAAILDQGQQRDAKIAREKWEAVQQAKIDAWYGPWSMGDIDALRLYTEWMQRKNNRPEFKRIHEELGLQWRNLRDRAYAIGFSALHYMPRSVYGDILGTPVMIQNGLDRVRRKIEAHEVEKAINGKFGVE